MSSQLLAIKYPIDHTVIATLERHSGIAADWGTVIEDELEMNRTTKAAAIEEIFLLLLPEYEWTAPDMTLLQELPSVEEWIGFFEGLCDDQGGPEEPMFKFNFS
jgi:hypothetical protein